jgi:transcriptional regulator with GAF, ATPase, and Fis domain
MDMKDSGADEDLLRKNVAEFEKYIITSALRRTGGNGREAAKQLGTTHRILMYRIQKYGIDITAFRIANRKKGVDSERD